MYLPHMPDTGVVSIEFTKTKFTNMLASIVDGGLMSHEMTLPTEEFLARLVSCWIDELAFMFSLTARGVRTRPL
jgi:hypothetical protein